MATPRDVWDVGWLTVNPQPGQVGNAVMDGHLDSATGIAVFWHLSDLRPGDTVTVTAADNRRLVFSVTDVESYEPAAAPLDRIFGPADTPRLNLITCAGSWDATTHRYTRRLVVYTQLERTDPAGKST